MTTAYKINLHHLHLDARFAAVQNSGRCVSNIRPQFSLGAPSEQDLAEPEAMLLVGTSYIF